MTHRIGIGGIAIESSTFSPQKTGLDSFVIHRGAEYFENTPFFVDSTFEGRTDVSWFPTLKARSIPNGVVLAETYRLLKTEMLERIEAVLPLDGFFFDVHGAMSVDGLDDAEGDLARSIRDLVGSDCVISAGMDLHGNVTEELVSLIDCFTAYRQAPHLDAMETKARAVRNLLDLLDRNVRPSRAWLKIPVVLPGERTSTFWEPGRTVYEKLEESDVVEGVYDASLWVGYVWADQPRASATTVVTGFDEVAISAEAVTIARRFWEARADFEFDREAGTADWTIEQALSQPDGPVFISDAGDNPVAGGAGDVAYMVARLLVRPELASGERKVIVGAVPNPEAAATAIAAGLGNEVSITIGGWLDPVNGPKVDLHGEVVSIVLGDSVGGDIAVVRSGGIYVIVPSRRKPYHHIRDFTEAGFDVSDFDIVVSKVGYIEQEWFDISTRSYMALTPGGVNQDIVSLPFTRIDRPIYPLDPDMAEPEWTPTVFPPIQSSNSERQSE
ncbi:MAG: M81 family metallopeptidase [Thermomicrobiales bacterium]